MIGASDVETLAIERFEARGMPMGEDSIETVIWTGRFVQAWRDHASVRMVKRRAVQSHRWSSARAKDPHVRDALHDPDGAPGHQASAAAQYGGTTRAWPAGVGAAPNQN